MGVLNMFLPVASGCSTVKKKYRCPAMIPRRFGSNGDPNITSIASMAHGK